VHFLAWSSSCGLQFDCSPLSELLGALAWVWHRVSPG